MKSMVIDALIEIEERAKRMTEEGEKLENNLPARIHDMQNKTNLKYENDYNERLDKEIREMDAKTAEEIEKHEKEYEDKLSSMEQMFKQNEQLWTEEIFKRITEIKPLGGD